MHATFGTDRAGRLRGRHTEVFVPDLRGRVLVARVERQNRHIGGATTEERLVVIRVLQPLLGAKRSSGEPILSLDALILRERDVDALHVLLRDVTAVHTGIALDLDESVGRGRGRR